MKDCLVFWTSFDGFDGGTCQDAMNKLDIPKTGGDRYKFRGLWHRVEMQVLLNLKEMKTAKDFSKETNVIPQTFVCS